MTPLWPIAVITFKEGIRSRAVYGISLFAVMLLGLSPMISYMAPRDVGKVAVDMALSTISFSGLLIVLFIGINLMAKDLDRRTIYMVLAKPISRGEYIFGKFFGMMLLMISAIIIISGLSALSLLMLKANYSAYFERFSWSLVFLGIVFITMMLVLLSALSFLFASLSSSSFITLALTIISYLIGQSMSDVKALLEAQLAAGAPVSAVTVTMVKVAYYLLPNLSLFDIKSSVAHGIPLPPSRVAWTMLYGVVYSAMVLTIASLFFRKREFP
jgi:ABC-type transport system involved in multi-copper enzyme maturation permease subunit